LNKLILFGGIDVIFNKACNHFASPWLRTAI
jgi:hypothetical protein